MPIAKTKRTNAEIIVVGIISRLSVAMAKALERVDVRRLDIVVGDLAERSLNFIMKDTLERDVVDR